MHTTLRIDDAVYRAAKAEAARRGITLTRFIEEALRLRLESLSSEAAARPDVQERNRLMESLLQATAYFRVGPKPERSELHER
ncbi:MAG: hypothetical protein Kow001_04060 [Acidobacteriota bacterium]